MQGFIAKNQDGPSFFQCTEENRVMGVIALNGRSKVTSSHCFQSLPELIRLFETKKTNWHSSLDFSRIDGCYKPKVSAKYPLLHVNCDPKCESSEY